MHKCDSPVCSCLQNKEKEGTINSGMKTTNVQLKEIWI